MVMQEKIDAGADFVMTQYFYDAQNFLHFINECKEAGITCPIIPGDIYMIKIVLLSSF